MEIIAQIFGLTMISIIVICLGWTIAQCIFIGTNGFEGLHKRNKKLLERAGKLMRKK
tara:strand:+ start:206 stop:376 length:171 start_codon:yes stop_codon:yes gene_type:complete